MVARRRRVIWAEQARIALDEALAYVAQDSVSAARRMLIEALQTAAELELMSERGRMVPELGRETIREVFVYRYRLLYEITEAEVRVLAFLHGARDFGRWQRGE